MTKHKAEKRAIRDRMAKTGERYTTARHYHLALHHAAPASGALPPAPDTEPETAASFPASPAPRPGSAPVPRPSPGPGTATAANASVSTANGRSAGSTLATAGGARADEANDVVVAQPAAPAASDAGAAPDAGPAASPAPAPVDQAEWVEHPGVSDETILHATGRSWNEWFTLLDDWGAAERSHAEIARFVNETSDIGGWWAQGITVGYERARGRRKLHQRPDGFTINASKTVAVPAERLFASFTDDTLRDQWLPSNTLRPRTSQPPRSARFDLVGTESRVNVTITAKGEQKSSVQIEEIKLASEDQIAPRKAFWKEKLAGLNVLLTASVGS